MRYQKLSDLIGLSSAALCLVHCIAFPLVLFLQAAWLHNHWIDAGFAAMGLYAVLNSTKKKSSSKTTAAVLWFSVLLVISCVLIGFVTGGRHSNLMYVGTVGLIAGHLLNYNHHKHKKNASRKKKIAGYRPQRVFRGRQNHSA